MQNAGAYLKSVREENGYSISEVSKNTKISPAVIRALEEGRLDNIDPVYLKGFLKMYCRFLRVDWQEFLREYPVTTAAKHSHKPVGSGLASDKPEGDGGQPNSRSHKPEGDGGQPNSRSHRQSHKQWKGIKYPFDRFILEKKKIILAGLSVVAGAFLILLVLRGCRPPLGHKPAGSGLPSDRQSHKPAGSGLPSDRQSHKPAAPLSLKNPRKTTVPAQSAPALAPPKTVVQPDVSASKESRPKKITLVIRAKEGSFIKVKVDGRTVYQGLLRKGNAESWSAKDKIELSVGNAAAVALEVDGKVFSSLGRKGQPLKNILINREGLKINP